MKRIETEASIIRMLASFKAEIDTAGTMERRDVFLVAEDLLIPLFKVVFGFTHLRNLNQDKVNYPGIDLGDEEKGVAIQVTATKTSDKIKHTLRQFVKYSLFEKYQKLIVYILTEKQQSYSGAGYEEIIGERFSFDKDRDIWDYQTIIKRIANLDGDQLERAVL